MYFEDLTAYRYCLPYELPGVRNVGWLDAAHTYAKGRLSEGVISKLRKIICTRSVDTDTHVNVIRGTHACAICGEERVELLCGGGRMILGMSEIWIPASRGYFASPSMVLHYIERHEYLPPQEYVDAVVGLDFHQRFNAQEAYDHLLIEQDGR